MSSIAAAAASPRSRHSAARRPGSSSSARVRMASALISGPPAALAWVFCSSTAWRTPASPPRSTCSAMARCSGASAASTASRWARPGCSRLAVGRGGRAAPPPDPPAPTGARPGRSRPERSRAGRSPPGRSPRGRSPPGRSPPGRSPADRSARGRSPPGRSPPGRSPPGRSPPGRSPRGRSPAGRSARGRSRSRLLGLGRRHRRHVDAVEVEVGLGLHHISDLCPLVQHGGGDDSLGLTRPGGAPGPGAVGAGAGELDVDAGHTAPNLANAGRG